MKKVLFFAVGLISTTTIAQETQKMGINKERPEATLNVKSKTGNTTTATKNLLLENGAGTDLVTVLDNGNVGVGTATPNKKLHIVGDVNITDGTQGAGKVLTSDASGNASWVSPLKLKKTSFYEMLPVVNSAPGYVGEKRLVPNTPNILESNGKVLEYIAPASGYYQVKLASFLKLKSETGMASFYFQILNDANDDLTNDEQYSYTLKDSWFNTGYTRTVELTAGQKIKFAIFPREGVELAIPAHPLSYRNYVEVVYIGEGNSKVNN